MCDSPRELLPAEVNQYPERQLWAILVFTHYLAELLDHKRHFLTPAYIRFHEKGNNQTNSNWILLFTINFWELIKVWKQCEVKVFSSIIPKGDGSVLIEHFQKEFVKQLNQQVCDRNGPAFKPNCPAKHFIHRHYYSGLGVLTSIHKYLCLFRNTSPSYSHKWREEKSGMLFFHFIVCVREGWGAWFFFLKDHGGITELFYTSEIQVSEYLFCK